MHPPHSDPFSTKYHNPKELKPPKEGRELRCDVGCRGKIIHVRCRNTPAGALCLHKTPLLWAGFPDDFEPGNSQAMASHALAGKTVRIAHQEQRGWRS